MKQNRIFLSLAILLIASLACSLFGGGSSGSEEVVPSGGGGGSGDFDTEFPLPSDVENYMDLGEAGINYQTSMDLNEVVEFYRGAFKGAGYDERDITTSITDTTFSIVWDGHPNGKAIVVQGVDLGDGTVNVNVRFEDV
jgi:hypothetical protein